MPDRAERDQFDRVTEAVLVASRALVAVASRSIAAIDDDVTLPQFRALVVLAHDGDTTVGQLARELRIQPSTATRLCDRLERQRLIRRGADPNNRRTVMIGLSPKGRRLVRTVTATRRQEIAAVLAKVPPHRRAAIIDALEAFNLAAGEDPTPIAW